MCIRDSFEAVSLFQTKYLEIASCAVSLLNDIWVRVEHSLLQKLKSIAVQAVYRQDVKEMWGRVEHLLASKECIKYFGHEKNSQNICIFQIPFSQWWVPQTKKIIFRCFFEHRLIYLCVKFQVCLACPTGFLPTNATFFTNIWREYFSQIFWEFLTSQKWNF